MTRIALAFILLHYILPPVLFTCCIKFLGFNMRKESLLLFTFEVTNECIFNTQGGCSPVGFYVFVFGVFFGWSFFIKLTTYLDLYLRKGTFDWFFKGSVPKITAGFSRVLCLCWAIFCITRIFQRSQNIMSQYFENKPVYLMRSVQYFLKDGVYGNTVIHTKDETELLINIQLRVKFEHIYNSSGMHKTIWVSCSSLLLCSPE